MSNSLFPIFVINLKKSPERKVQINQQLSDLGLECQYIEAVDGTQYTPYQLVEKYGRQIFYTNTYNKQRMTLGAVGCLLSHIKFYEHMMENNIPAACVLEDDAILSPHLPEILQSDIIQKVPWGTLLLGHYSKYRKSFNKGAEPVYWKTEVCRGHYIAKPAEFPFTTLGYLIKLSTAKKLHRLSFPIRMPADWVTGNTELVGDTLRIITPPCIVADKYHRGKSTVRGSANADLPMELQKEIPTLSLRRYITVGLAKFVLGSRKQRAQAAYDRDKEPSTHMLKNWQQKSASSNRKDRRPKSKIKQEARKRRKHESLTNMVIQIIKMRYHIQKSLWCRMRRITSIQGALYISLRLILNIPVTVLSILAFLIQATARNIYYGKMFTTIRIYIKKLGLFKYTRVV
ncbi:MAG: glycosyltransferase family 25 protein [Chromatiales bacterium]|nr:glycosyltransferase family 25 protein [Chromatiales bacterium]